MTLLAYSTVLGIPMPASEFKQLRNSLGAHGLAAGVLRNCFLGLRE